MPLNSPTNSTACYVEPGHLYIVATPIGNKDDITLRALSVLKQVDLVAAEDTRHTAKLFSLHQIKNQLISYHEHNKKERMPLLISRLKSGAAIALVSNAGTPTVSDPGYYLVKTAIEKGIPVVPIPGVSAMVAALSVSGLPTNAFVFIGFLDRKKQKRMKQIERFKYEGRTVILYESPRRMLSLLQELTEVIGNRHCVLSREMTKIYEEFIRGSFSEILTALKDRPGIKGECTLLIAGGEDEPISMEAVRDEIKTALAISDISSSDLSKALAKKIGISKKIVYKEILKLKASP